MKKATLLKVVFSIFKFPLGSIGNVAFVTNDNTFLIPASDNKLEGTTLRNAMKKI